MRSLRQVVGIVVRWDIHISLRDCAIVVPTDIINIQIVRATVARPGMGSITVARAINVSRDTINMIQVQDIVARMGTPISTMECATHASKGIIPIPPADVIAVRQDILTTGMDIAGPDPAQHRRIEHGIQIHIVIVHPIHITRGIHTSIQRNEFKRCGV
jgi:hypothetical protein